MISTMEIERALCDLWASVSLIPVSMYEKLDLGETKSTNISLQVADKLIKYLIGGIRGCAHRDWVVVYSN